MAADKRPRAVEPVPHRSPHTSYVGSKATWWIPKPPAPRLSADIAATVWLIAFPIVAATLLWCYEAGKPLWPFGRPVVSTGEILLRYEIVLATCLVYVTVRSLPRWINHYRLAKRDAEAIPKAIEQEQWELAGLLLHRYCLLASGIRRHLSKTTASRVASWDKILQKRLPRHHRLYIYYHRKTPQLPPDAAASFAPAIIPPPKPSLWSAVALVPIAMVLYLLILDILRSRYWHRLVLFNAVLLIVILVFYGGYFLLTLLGRSHYFRFAPGRVQLVRFHVFRRRPSIETYDLQRGDTVLDLSSDWPTMTLLNTPTYRSESFRLPWNDDVTEALLRACLSTAPSPPLPEEDLLA